jgi:nicotinamide riboside transporter PnuC
MEILLQYYGLDWLSMILGFTGAWMITEKRPIGFLFTILSVLFALATALMANQYGFVIANIISIGIAGRGYYKWKNPNSTLNDSTNMT